MDSGRRLRIEHSGHVFRLYDRIIVNADKASEELDWYPEDWRHYIGTYDGHICNIHPSEPKVQVCMDRGEYYPGNRKLNAWISVSSLIPTDKGNALGPGSRVMLLHETQSRTDYLVGTIVGVEFGVHPYGEDCFPPDIRVRVDWDEDALDAERGIPGILEDVYEAWTEEPHDRSMDGALILSWYPEGWLHMLEKKKTAIEQEIEAQKQRMREARTKFA